MDVFAAGMGHAVEPLDANNVSWVNPLLPALDLGPLEEGPMVASLFVFALGFAIILVVLYVF